MLFNSRYEPWLDHPQYTPPVRPGGYHLQKLIISLNNDVCEKYAPFATVFGPGSKQQYDILKSQLPEGFKITYESPKAMNFWHAERPEPSQYLVVVDKV